MAMDISVAPTQDGVIASPAPLRPAPPASIVIFGASGDLTQRKLIPALFDLYLEGLLTDRFNVIGMARSHITDDEFRVMARKGIEEYTHHKHVDDALWEKFGSKLYYESGQFNETEAYERLSQKLDECDASNGTLGNRLFYMATPPELFPVITEQLGLTGLNKSPSDGWVRTVIEKPFGTSLATAQQLNIQVREVFHESQIYRIDHYLGKETVQNILAFRLANGIFEPIWNRNYIDHVQITVAESIGVDRRGGYYEQSGGFRDMVENHMLQLLAIVAMEPPVAFEAEPVRDEKLKVLKALRRIHPSQVGELTLRGQYAAGSPGGTLVPGYRGEEHVAPDSTTETFVAAKLFVDNWRWAGTPFYLRHGKRLPKRVTEIAITFKRAPQTFFKGEERLQPNVLAMRIQPDEGMTLRFAAKVPGVTMRLQDVDMNFAYGSSFGENAVAQSEAYERLLLDAMMGDRTLFTRADEVEQAWIWAEDVLEGWAARPSDVHPYPAGSWGPAWADPFIERDGRQWRTL